MKNLLLAGLFLFVITYAYSQPLAGDYRSATTGSWSTLGTWERFNGSAWATPTVGEGVPSSASGAITIRSTHTVLVDVNVIADELSIETGGAVVVGTGVLTISNGPGTDMTVDGNLFVITEFILQDGATHAGTTIVNTFFSGGKYRHQYTNAEGTIPLANWTAGSEVIIEGYTSAFTATAAGNWDQNFGHVTWNCPSQTGNISLAGRLTSVNNLQVLGTGSSVLSLSTNENPVIDILGNLVVDGTARLHVSTTGASTVVNVGGNFVFNSTNAVGNRSVLTTTGSAIVNITGDFLMNAPGGLLRLASGAGGNGTLNITGDFDLTDGTLTRAGSGALGNIAFVGLDPTLHSFSRTGGAITSAVQYSIPAGNTLTVLGESTMSGTGGSGITVDGTLVLQSENPTGAIVNGTGAGAGNVRVATANRIYNPGSVIIYQGSGAQFMGNGQPSQADVTTIIDNVSGVSVAANNLNVAGNLTLQNGDFTVDGFNFTLGGNATLTNGDINFNTSGAARTLTFGGLINLSGGNLNVASGTANANLVINGDLAGSNSITFAGANSNLIINGSGNLSIDFPIPAATMLESVTINRGSDGLIVFPQDVQATDDVTITAGLMRMNGNLTVNDDLNISTGSTLFFEGRVLELRSQFNNSLTGGVLSADAGSTLNIFGTGLLGTLAFSPTGNTVGTFHLNRTGPGNPKVTLSNLAPVIVEDIFVLEVGTILNDQGLTFGVDAMVTRYNTGSFVAGSTTPLGGPYDLFYEGTPNPNITTGVEALGLIRNLTDNFTGTVTVAAGSIVTIQEALTVNAGTFSAGVGNLISTDTWSNFSTFNSGSSTITLTGDMLNDGVFNRNTGTFVFAGNTSVTGLNNPSFQNIVIDGTLTPFPTLNIHGNFTNNGTLNDGGTGTVAFLGTAGNPQVVSGTTVTNFNNINVSNTSANPDVVLESNQNLRGVLTLASSATFDADGSGDDVVFTLISTGDDPTEDAAIAPLPNVAAQVQGNVTVQRFMSLEGSSDLGPDRIYRYISSPVQNGTVADIQNEIPVTGKFTGASTCTGCLTNPSLYYYDETFPGGFNDGYIAFPADNSTNADQFVPGRGYTLFVRGDVDPVLSAGSALWDLRGPVNRGNINYGVTFTNTGSPADDGWNLIGNPYPSTIDWESAGWTSRNRIASTIYIRDNATGQFATYTLGGSGSNGGSQYIALGQAFWIQTITGSGTPSLVSNETVKAAGTQTEFFRYRAPTNVLRLVLSDGKLRDETVIQFRDDATDGFDYQTDAWKLPNPSFNFSSVIEGLGNLAVNTLKNADLECSRLVNLDMSGVVPGTYTIEFSQVETFGNAGQISLIDNFAGEEIDLRSIGSYSFEVTPDSRSFGNNRFAVRFGEGGIRADFQVQSGITLCSGDGNSMYIDNSQRNVSYQLFAGSAPLSGAVTGNGSSIVLEIPSENLSGEIAELTVKATSGSCSIVRPVQFSILGSQLLPVGAERCGPGPLHLSIGGVDAGQKVNWYATAEGTTLLGEGVDFVTPELSETKTYYAEIPGSEACAGRRVPVLAVVHRNEPASIQQDVNVLLSSAAHGNQWYFNGQKIDGATGQSFMPSRSGSYQLEVTSGACTSTATYDYVQVSVSREKAIAVYPNPVSASDDLHIEVVAEVTGPIHIMNAAGMKVDELTPQLAAPGLWKASAKVDQLAQGVYLLKLTVDGRTQVMKFVRTQ